MHVNILIMRPEMHTQFTFGNVNSRGGNLGYEKGDVACIA
jgi:hypothetical protein